MKKLFLLFIAVLLLSACAAPPQKSVPSTAEEVTTTEAETVPSSAPTEPSHSAYFIPGVSTEDVTRFFNEVCLNAEMINSGDPSVIQKWTQPLFYCVSGNSTQEDLAVLNDFALWLNQMETFPGIYPVEETAQANLRIYFCDQEELLSRMGSQFSGTDGAVTFWYNNDEIFDAIICIRTDLDQVLRNSVILEELYNCLGPIQDTALRPDSIIYSGYSEPQALTQMDELLLNLLYHPDITCGMDMAACGEVIRRLYY